MRTYVNNVFGIFLLILLFVSSAEANPNLLGPSGLIYLPSAYPAGGIGYYSLSGNKITRFNTTFFNGALEAGVLRDKLQGGYSYNLKLPVLEESGMMPQIALGIYNYNNPALEKTNYIVVSKFIDSFGLTLHVGYRSKGDLKDAARLFNYSTIQNAIDDAKSDSGKTFFGFEYSFMPMFSIMGEKFDTSYNAGIRFNPMPMLSIDYDFLDIKKTRNLKEKKVLNFNLSFGF